MTVSIIGLGWLGLPLANFLQQKGYTVKGSTRSLDKKEQLDRQGIMVDQLSLNPDLEGTFPSRLFETDILFINIPPARRTKSDDFHPRQIQYLKQTIRDVGIGKVVYVSATSVYPSQNQVARETDTLTAETTGNPALWHAEQLLWKDKNYDLSVIRFGGLLGDDRVPGRYFSGKEQVPGHPPVNYIHREDAVKAIYWLVEKHLWNETFNIVSPEHPAKKDLFEKNAAELGFPPPTSYENPSSQKWKEISSEKWQRTGFQFKYPNPLDFTYFG